MHDRASKWTPEECSPTDGDCHSCDALFPRIANSVLVRINIDESIRVCGRQFAKVVASRILADLRCRIDAQDEVQPVLHGLRSAEGAKVICTIIEAVRKRGRERGLRFGNRVSTRQNVVEAIHAVRVSYSCGNHLSNRVPQSYRDPSNPCIRIRAEWSENAIEVVVTVDPTGDVPERVAES